MSAQTITEKILARHAGRDHVQPGDNIWVNVDVLMTHDVCGTGTIGVFHKQFGKDAKVWDPDKVVIIPDHYIFTKDAMANRNVDVLRNLLPSRNCPTSMMPAAIGTKVFVTLLCRKRATLGLGKFFWEPIVTHARRALLVNSPPASATPMPALSWAPVSCGLRFPKPCALFFTAICRHT
jgi:hypothetical protein